MQYLKNRLNKNFLLMISSDFIIICASVYFSFLIMFDFQAPSNLGMVSSFWVISIIVITKIVIFKLFKLYRGMWRYTSIWEMFNVLKANLISSLILTVSCSSFFGLSNLFISLLLIDFMICTGFISSSRIGIRMFYLYVKKNKTIDEGKNKLYKKILIIGAGYTGHAISGQLQQNPKTNIKIVGFLDDDKTRTGNVLNGVQVFGTVETISQLQIDFNEIYICIPSASGDQIRKIVDYCKETGKPFKTLPSIAELISGNISISQFREVSVIDLLGRDEIILDKNSIKNFILGKRVIVTGAGGSIGSELVRQCIIYKPSLLIMLDISELNLFQIEREVLKLNSSVLFKPVLCDIKDLSSLEKVFSEYKPQVVFHAAAYKHVPIQEHFPQEAIKTNIFGSINLIEKAIVNNVEKFVLVSTDKAVRPTNVMGATKRITEMVCQNSNRKDCNTEFMAVRFGNVLGSSGSVIPIFKQQIKDGGPLTITDPDMERYFMSIPEASQLILQAGSIGKGGEVFILDMGKPVKILDLAKDLIRLSGFEPYKDIVITTIGARPGEKKVEELSLKSEKLDKTKHDKIFVLNDSTKSRLDFKPIIKNVLILKSKLDKMTANEIRMYLSNILPEYKPDFGKHNHDMATKKAKA
jgi:FlaA1/EpsC-like NDP-sugar epimerase